ncbi:MAG TPA: DUF1573 domain-containing protein [Bacteroidales bacterium]|nr:DUF1573 domain-containing protein [Bacteroidales bacterium]
MKKINLSFLLVLFASVVLAQPQIKFDNTTYDFGTIKEEKGKVTGRFEFTNTGDQDLMIVKVQPGCGCTAANYTRTAVPPGGRGFIDATYDPYGRPGNFHKNIRVTTNEPRFTDPNAAPIQIFIKGSVEKRPPTVYELAGYKEGNGMIRVKERNGKITTTNAQKAKYDFLIKNFSKVPSPIEFTNLPKHIRIETSFGKVLKPDQEGKITVIYDAELKNQIGNFREVVVLTSNDSIEKKIALHLEMSVKEDFSKLTPEQLKKAPILHIETDTIRFGDLVKNTQSEQAIKVTNKGKTPLVIRQIIPSRSIYTVKAESMTIEPGQTITFTIHMNPRNLVGVQNATIDLISNDPRTPTKTLVILGNVKP